MKLYSKFCRKNGAQIDLTYGTPLLVDGWYQKQAPVCLRLKIFLNQNKYAIVAVSLAAAGAGGALQLFKNKINGEEAFMNVMDKIKVQTGDGVLSVKDLYDKGLREHEESESTDEFKKPEEFFRDWLRSADRMGLQMSSVTDNANAVNIQIAMEGSEIINNAGDLLDGESPMPFIELYTKNTIDADFDINNYDEDTQLEIKDSFINDMKEFEDNRRIKLSMFRVIEEKHKDGELDAWEKDIKESGEYTKEEANFLLSNLNRNTPWDSQGLNKWYKLLNKKGDNEIMGTSYFKLLRGTFGNGNVLQEAKEFHNDKYLEDATIKTIALKDQKYFDITKYLINNTKITKGESEDSEFANYAEDRRNRLGLTTSNEYAETNHGQHVELRDNFGERMSDSWFSNELTDNLRQQSLANFEEECDTLYEGKDSGDLCEEGVKIQKWFNLMYKNQVPYEYEHPNGRDEFKNKWAPVFRKALEERNNPTVSDPWKELNYKNFLSSKDELKYISSEERNFFENQFARTFFSLKSTELKYDVEAPTEAPTGSTGYGVNPTPQQPVVPVTQVGAQASVQGAQGTFQAIVTKIKVEQATTRVMGEYKRIASGMGRM